jgi:predicted transcriptional regulator
MAAKNKTSAATVRVAENQKIALDLRRRGHSYTEIAEMMNVNRATAHGYVTKALEDALEQVKADANVLRAEEVSRLDALLNGLWDDAESGNVMAVDKVLKIMERRAKLLGLDSPQRIALGGDKDGLPIKYTELTDADLERLAATGSA